MVFCRAAPGRSLQIPPSFMQNQKNTTQMRDVFLAEKEGFEPSRQLPQPTPLAGEPLTATWVLLHDAAIIADEVGMQPLRCPPNTVNRSALFGGERGIRTPGALRHHQFSRLAPSTPRPSLRVRRAALRRRPFSVRLNSIPIFALAVNPVLKDNYFVRICFY